MVAACALNLMGPMQHTAHVRIRSEFRPRLCKVALSNAQTNR